MADYTKSSIDRFGTYIKRQKQKYVLKQGGKKMADKLMPGSTTALRGGKRVVKNAAAAALNAQRRKKK